MVDCCRMESFECWQRTIRQCSRCAGIFGGFDGFASCAVYVKKINRKGCATFNEWAVRVRRETSCASACMCRAKIKVSAAVASTWYTCSGACGETVMRVVRSIYK